MLTALHVCPVSVQEILMLPLIMQRNSSCCSMRTAYTGLAVSRRHGCLLLLERRSQLARLLANLDLIS